jgi:NAD(P)-dependent dehydrogenase (short-subunit alcohol dehydrogenase family)
MLSVAGIDSGHADIADLAAAYTPTTNAIGSQLDKPINAAPQHHYLVNTAVATLGRWVSGSRTARRPRTAETGESRLSGTLQHTIDRIVEASGEACFIKADLAQGADRERLVDAAVDAYGPIDILVNNAAVTYVIPFMDYTEKRYRLMMDVQVYAPFHLSQLVLPSMRERRQGWIVNISSSAAIHPEPQIQRGSGIVYGMCKAALERFSTGLERKSTATTSPLTSSRPGSSKRPARCCTIWSPIRPEAVSSPWNTSQSRCISWQRVIRKR